MAARYYCHAVIHSTSRWNALNVNVNYAAKGTIHSPFPHTQETELRLRGRRKLGNSCESLVEPCALAPDE